MHLVASVILSELPSVTLKPTEVAVVGVVSAFIDVMCKHFSLYNAKLVTLLTCATFLFMGFELIIV